jgi:tRNA(fMet)-specific endonuclease VapC
MILLDTDHVSVLTDQRITIRENLLRGLDGATDDLALPILSIEELLRGWLAKIHSTRSPTGQIVPYLRLGKLVDFLASWPIAHWTEAAVNVYDSLRSKRIRIRTQDLKIASIALANDALLLSANLRDFEKVPELHVADWLSR